jgi:cbb3-type cytochrome oxidase maturation protein
MEVIYSLIPGMTFFGLVFVVILVWAVKKGQYEDMEGNASRILLDDEDDGPPNRPHVEENSKSNRAASAPDKDRI